MSLRRNRTLALLTIAITIIAVAACKRSGGDDDGSAGAGDPTNPANPINPTPSSSEDERGSVGVPPTGAAYCVDLGFTLTADSKCQFPDGTSCEEWSFYRGECGQTHSYCNQHGGTIANRIEDAGNWTATYGVCTLHGKECQEGDFIATGHCE